MIIRRLALLLLALAASTVTTQADRPRVIVSTDAGGSDDDDLQSLVHYLVYADAFDTEGLVSSPPGAGRAEDILAVIDVYARDLPALRSHSERYPAPEALERLVKQGATDPAPEAGFSAPTDGSEWIAQAARVDDPRPLWVLVWGSVTDVAQAVHDHPEIKDRLRVYFIASWNERQDPHSARYLHDHHPDLWMIHNDSTFRGWYVGGEQGGDLGNASFVTEHVDGHGALGRYFATLHAAGTKAASIKMGDTPSVAYLLNGDQDDPTAASWGGRFVPKPGRPHWYEDDPAPEQAAGKYPGAQTVNRWRTDYLRDWQKRMDRCIPPAG